MVHESLKVLNHVLLLRHDFPLVELSKISIAWILEVLFHAVHDVLVDAERFDEAVADGTQDLMCSDSNNKDNENKSRY